MNAAGWRAATGRRAQQILRGYDRYLRLANLFDDPSTWISRAKDRWSGGTHYEVAGELLRMQTTARGIELGPRPGKLTGPPTEILTWQEVKRLALSVPPHVREELVQAERELTAHAGRYPRFVATGIAVGCGPRPAIGPLTEAQAAYQQQMAAWEAAGELELWQGRQSTLKAAVGGLLDKALPLVDDTEPEDLLELLDQTESGPVRPVGPDAPPTRRQDGLTGRAGTPPANISSGEVPMAVIGVGRETIPVAAVRRALPVGSRLQVFYLRGQREQTEPDVRTVTKQSGYQMVTSSAAVPKGSRLAWAGVSAERDANGILIIRDAEGSPVVAYKPLTNGDPDPTAATMPVDQPLKPRYAEARRTTDPSTLDDIAGSEIPTDRRAAAENPHTAAVTLVRLAADEHVIVRRAAAGNPNTPAAALERLADDPDQAPAVNETKVSWLVARNPNTSAPTLTRLADNDDPMVRAAVGRHLNAPPALLEQLAAPGPGRTWVDSDVRQALASNPNTPPSILASWENCDGFTMPLVAKNPSTPTDVLERLSRDTATGNSTRAAAATNPALSPSVLWRLALEDDDTWVCAHAARNPNIDDVDAHRVALDKEPEVRRALAANEHVDPAVLERLQADPDPVVRSVLAMNPSLTPATIHALTNDETPSVRAAAAANPATPAGARTDRDSPGTKAAIHPQAAASTAGRPATSTDPGPAPATRTPTPTPM